MLTWLLPLLAFTCGLAIAAQAGINAGLARYLGGPVLAAAVSFAVGTAALASVCLAAGITWPSPAQWQAAPWYSWIGGLLGAAFVTLAVVLAPRLGAATLIACVVAGQLCASLVLDHYGWLGFPVHPVNWQRLAGAVLLFAGVVLLVRH